jgi:hypothetical protein
LVLFMISAGDTELLLLSGFTSLAPNARTRATQLSAACVSSVRYNPTRGLIPGEHYSLVYVNFIDKRRLPSPSGACAARRRSLTIREKGYGDGGPSSATGLLPVTPLLTGSEDRVPSKPRVPKRRSLPTDLKTISAELPRPALPALGHHWLMPCTP